METNYVTEGVELIEDACDMINEALFDADTTGGIDAAKTRALIAIAMLLVPIARQAAGQ